MSEARKRFFRSRGAKAWFRLGAIHIPSAPQGRVTTPGVCDAHAPAVGTATVRANPETAAPNLKSLQSA